MMQIQKYTLKCEQCGDIFEHYARKTNVEKLFCERCSRKRMNDRQRAYQRKRYANDKRTH